MFDEEAQFMTRNLEEWRGNGKEEEEEERSLINRS